MRMKIPEIVQACGGKLLSGDPETAVTSFVTDSRQIKSGAMFVPMKGERVDSHSYIRELLAGEAAASFTEREIETASGKPIVLVSSAVKALQKVAEFYRKRFEVPIVGITGSVGKTTAKEMIALTLSAQYRVMKTQGNQNSQIGVPMTMFTLKKTDQAAVVEMGISMPGEMERLGKIVRPTLAVINNIGVTHIEHLKTQENILAEKARITDFLAADGKLFVNGDDPLLEALSREKHEFGVITFGMNKNCHWRAVELDATEKGTFFICENKGRRSPVFVPAAGLHNVRNALVAMAVAQELSVPPEEAARAIASYKPPKMRQEILDLGEVKLIDDSYNASPDSVKAGLDILAGMQVTGRKIAVLGDMFELGDHAPIAHFEIGKTAREKGIDCLVAVGEMAGEIGKGFGSENFTAFAVNEAATKFLCGQVKAGDALLVKGSRGMKMEEIIAGLKEHFSR